jgi:copper oxidase (laccase) domain-containing protein
MKRTLPKELSDEFEERAKEAKTAADLQNIIQMLFAKYGDTVKQSFMIFTHGKQQHIYVSMDRKMVRAMAKVMEYCRVTGDDINAVMSPIVVACMREAEKKLAARSGESDRLKDEPEDTLRS